MTPPSWLRVLAIMLVAQVASTLLGRVAPTLAPALMVRQGWSEAQVGAISSMASLGSALFLLAGLPVLRHFGPVRCMQVGLALGAIGVAMVSGPWALALLGGVMVGLCYGPANSAGSEVLQHHAPPGHRNLVFSIKQTGVPIGGVAAGLLLPLLATRFGPGPVMAGVSLLAVLPLVLLQPVRAGLDPSGPVVHAVPLWRQVASVPNLLRPLKSLSDIPRLRALGLSGAAIAFSQGGWFTFFVTYLSVELHWSLAQAGAAYALMQSVSAVGRPFLGWLSDRLGSGVPILRACGVGSALTTLALAMTSPATPEGWIWALAAVAGITVSSWNGVQLAEVARAAPGSRVSDTASGATLLVFCAYVVSPVWVALCLWAGGGFGAAFAGQALVTLGCVPALRGVDRAVVAA